MSSVGLIACLLSKWCSSSCSPRLLAGAAIAADAANATLRYVPFGGLYHGDRLLESQGGRSCSRLRGFVDFVGSGRQDSGSCKDTKYDRTTRTFGFPRNRYRQQEAACRLAAEKTRLMSFSMHLGTNDIAQQSKATDAIIAAFTTLVEVMRASNPKMKIVVRVGPSQVRRGRGDDLDSIRARD